MAKGSGETKQNGVQWLRQDHCADKLTQPIVNCTRTACDQVSEHSIMEDEEICDV